MRLDYWRVSAWVVHVGKRPVTFRRDQATLTIGAVTFDIESCRVNRDGS